jgi:hypothetical protein
MQNNNPLDISLSACSDVQQQQQQQEQEILILGPSINKYTGTKVSNGTLHLMTNTECTSKQSNIKMLRGFSPRANYTDERPSLVGEVSANFLQIEG